VRVDIKAGTISGAGSLIQLKEITVPDSDSARPAPTIPNSTA
jgi:hypothetical protein